MGSNAIVLELNSLSVCYLEREHLLELGRPALDYLTELIHRRPRLWPRDVKHLHELLERHGSQRMRAAFEHALAERLFGCEYIVDLLDHSPACSSRSAQQELAL